MKIFIPVHENSAEFLAETLPSIREQMVEMVLVFCPLTAAKPKWKPVVKELCRTQMLLSGDEFPVINDAEFKNLFDDNYREMKFFLENNKDYGAVSLFASPAFPPESGHVCAGVVMFRKKALEVTRFDLFPAETSCKSVMESLKAKNWKYGYLDNKERCKKDLRAIK
jgi:hypothetical protein